MRMREASEQRPTVDSRSCRPSREGRVQSLVSGLPEGFREAERVPLGTKVRAFSATAAVGTVAERPLEI
jgi:hypothetical protein